MQFGKRERGGRGALFGDVDPLENNARGGMFDHELAEQENDRNIDGLHERVELLKRVTLDMHEEAQAHNALLERMGQNIVGARGALGGLMDKLDKVFSTKSSRRVLTIVGVVVVLFLVVYYFAKK
eukprot:jgi/Mesvir1/18944/Mv18915-RA.1